MSKVLTSAAINEAYERCRIRKHENRKEAVAVPGFLTVAHAFNRLRLSSQSSFVLSSIKKLSKTLRRSNGCQGAPWIVARHIMEQDKDYPLDVTDKLLAMAQALEYISVVHPEGAVNDMAYIIIEDDRCRKECLIRKDYRRAKWD